ncbi:MAG: AI-2E family transporter [Thomasclavelia sp.]
MKDKLIKYGYYLLILIMIVLAVYVLVNWLVPLFFSCLIVLILQPLLAKEIKLLKLSNPFLIKIVIVLNYLFFIAVIITVIIFSLVQIYQVLEILPTYLNNLYQILSTNHYIIDLGNYLDIIYSGSMSIVESVSSGFITWLIAFIIKIPSFLFDLMFVIITALFMLLDYDFIETKVIKKYPAVSLTIEMVKNVLSNLFKASCIIMFVVFVQLWLGFSIIGLNQSIMLACIIAIVDFLPVLGIDMIMIPWIIIAALTNKIALALMLLVLYIIVVVTKNIIEPKLLAKNLGLNPVISLIGMYLGMRLFGAIGLFVVPTLIMVLMQMIKAKELLKSNE